jgi:hypothetical protein
VLAQLPILTLITWGLGSLLTLVLLIRMIVGGQFRVYPLFALYLACNFLQAVFAAYLYQRFGFNSKLTYRLVWTSQALVVAARAFVAGELCHNILGKFKGIWAMSARILVACGIMVLCAALYFGKSDYQFMVIRIEIGLESFIATTIVGLFWFARYYQVQIPIATGLLGLGLGLNSCSRILNDAVFEQYVNSYQTVWNYVSSAAFIAILVLWIWALRKAVVLEVAEPRLRPKQVYQNLMPQVNRKLIELNDQMSRLWSTESTRP